MARPKSHKAANAAVRADRLLRREFSRLHKAMSDWLDGGDSDAIDVALDEVMQSPFYYPYEPIREGLARDERIVLLSQRLAVANQIATRLARELRAVEKARVGIRDQLLNTIAEPPDVPEYVVKLWKRLQAVGATQSDLQPQSKALAKAMLDTARAHNESRKSDASQEEDDDEPIAAWDELPREFAGFRLRDIDPEEARDFEVCPLPPSTDIADFTADGQRPPIGATRRATITAWGKIIEAWGAQKNRKMPPMNAAAWAALLANHLPNDGSDLAALNGFELQSPWERDGIVVIERVPMHKSALARYDDEDDVPY